MEIHWNSADDKWPGSTALVTLKRLSGEAEMSGTAAKYGDG